jgi:hypothetical protein
VDLLRPRRRTGTAHDRAHTIALDWVDLYDGDSPATRRQPRDPASWATMSADLDSAAAHLSAQGQRDVHVRGAVRQATFFAVGAQLAQVTPGRAPTRRYGTGATTPPRQQDRPPALGVPAERHVSRSGERGTARTRSQQG